MNERIDAFYNRMKKKKVAFVGVGVSNSPAIDLFLRQGVDVTVCDRRDAAAIGAAAPEWKRKGAKLRFGPDYLDHLDADVIIRAPGVYFNMPGLQRLRQRGAVLTSEMELFFDLCPCPIIGVTGSDGKTTTTTLIARMLEWEGRKVHLGGNIGRALLPLLTEISSDDVAVVELSSFQLISMRQSPDISVITNITPNHLDVHGEMREYIDAKRNVYLHQNAFSRTVLGLDNDITASFAPEVRGECLGFSLRKPVAHGAYLREDGTLCTSCRGLVTELLHKEEIVLPGIHNVANYLAAISTVMGMVEPGSIRAVARMFSGVEHRIELVREREGVRWYNDSIATSPTRAIAALRSFDRPIVMIAGGYDKKIPFEPLAPELVEHVRLLILTGDTAPKIEQALKGYSGYRGSPEILHAGDLPHAVQLAAERSEMGDVVTLSPACASFDKYPNFEARGIHFKELVEAL